jgi:WD40 repeat protein
MSPGPHLLRWSLILLALVPSGPARSAEPTAEDIARLIKQLGSENFAEREAASKRLGALGEPALEQLRQAAQSADPEVRRRARELCAAIERRLHGELRCLVGHRGGVWALAVSPDGKQLLSSGEDKVPRLWSVEPMREGRAITERAEASRFPVFSPDGRQVLSGAADHTVVLWDLASGKDVRRFEGGTGLANGLAFTPDGRYILAISSDSLLAWETATGKRLYRNKVPRAVGLAASPDGRTAATSSMDRSIHLWDVQTGRLIRTYVGHTAAVWNVVFSSDGRRLLSAGWDGSARLWDVALGKEVRRFEGHRGHVYSVAFSPDGRRVLTGGQDGTLRLWDTETGKELHCYEGHSGPIWKALFYADGRRAASASSDQTIRLWAVPK